MKTIQTKDLIGAALDWAVAKAEGIDLDSYLGVYSPSTDPTEGYPIIEREDIATWKNDDEWRAAHPENPDNGYYDSSMGVLDVSHSDGVSGPTVLIAAMRAYVASKLGDTIKIPDELA